MNFPVIPIGRRHSRRFSPVVIPFLLMVLLLSACSPKKEKTAPRPPAPVTVTTAGQKNVPVQLAATGNVEAYSIVAVKAQVNGTVAQVHFKEGQDVRNGDLLFTIDPRPFAAALRQAEANLARDRAQARNAEEQARRYGSLVKDGIVTQEQYDQLRAAAEAYSATVAADLAAVENAKIQLEYCSIRAPHSGRTGSLVVNVGNVVKANEAPALVTINQVSPVYVAFSVPEKVLPEIRRHMAAGDLKVEALLPGDGNVAESGSISFIDNLVDTTTGTIRVKGTFANKSRRLWPGQFANVALTLTTRPNAVVVPTQAVQTGQQGAYLFVVKADKSAELRPVTVGPALNGETVIEKGLQPGETVVTDGQIRLVPGAKVEIKQDPKGPKGPGTGTREGLKDQGPVKSPSGKDTVPSQGKRQ